MTQIGSCWCGRMATDAGHYPDGRVIMRCSKGHTWTVGGEEEEDKTRDLGLDEPILTFDEIEEAYLFGQKRHHHRRGQGGQHRWGWNPTAEQAAHWNGISAVAELQVAKMLGREWLSCGLQPDEPGAGDVEGGVSVRWTNRTNGSLIVHEDEPDTLKSVLVVGPCRFELMVVGWIPVGLAKSPGFWRDDVRHPAFFVPQSALRDMESLETGGWHCWRRCP